MGMQTLHWRQGMRKEMEMEMEEEKDQLQQQGWRKIINSCVRAHNKTCIRTRLLHLLLQLQGEEKAFLIGHHLGPKNKYALFQNSNKYINLFFNLSISCLCRKPSPCFFRGWCTCLLGSRNWREGYRKALEFGVQEENKWGCIGIGV